MVHSAFPFLADPADGKHNAKDHQIEAVEKTSEALQHSDRATVVMACGTGKTLTQMWTAQSQDPMETDEDHVHCFVSAPPKDSPAKIVGLLKGYSSRIVRQKFPHLAKRTGKDQLWTSAYYVGTAGAVSSEVIKRYIMECQGK